jgi:hypothetical protein
MVYNTKLLGFGLFPSSGILENRKHDVTGRGKTPTQLGPLESANLLGPVIEISSFYVAQLSRFLLPLT